MKIHLISLSLILANISLTAGERIDHLVKNGDLVFDIGAHNGDKTINYLQSGAQVICFEPQPLCIEKLQTRFKMNQSVTIVPKGLGSTKTMLRLMICSQAPTISTINPEWKEGRFKHFAWDKEIMVEITTLDKAIKEFGLPNFCKIDVEGFELEVLKGLSQPIPCLSFEITAEYLNNAEECLQLLANIGYTKFNFGEGESPFLKFDTYLNKNEIITILQVLSQNNSDLWGDIYAKM